MTALIAAKTKKKSQPNQINSGLTALAAADMQTLLKDTREVGVPVGHIQEGKEVEGLVFRKGQSVVYVDLSPWGTGVIYKGDLMGSAYDLKRLKVGDPITAKVVARENDEGFIELSLKEIGNRKAWEALRAAYEAQTPLKAKVTSANKGGLMMEANGQSGFLPASQLGPKNYPRVEDGNEERILMKLRALVGQTLTVKVLDCNEADQNQKLIFSEKAAEENTLIAALEKYRVGDVIEGDVSGIVDFGAFVKFGNNLEGLVHISELGWKLIEDPRAIISIGARVKAKIIGINGTQVSLSIKALQENPWEKIKDKYKVGETYPGQVTKINPFGAFVYLDKDIHGLAHISQFGSEEKMAKLIKMGETYDFKITAMKPDQHRMSLKLAALAKAETKTAAKAVSAPAARSSEAAAAKPARVGTAKRAVKSAGAKTKAKAAKKTKK